MKKNNYLQIFTLSLSLENSKVRQIQKKQLCSQQPINHTDFFSFHLTY